MLQKFLESDVIEDAKGKELYKFDEGAHLYRFVTQPSLLNFLDDSAKGEKSDLCISNPYAVLGMATANEDIDTESMSSSERLPSADPIPTAKYNVSQTQIASIWKELTLARFVIINLYLSDLLVHYMYDCFIAYSHPFIHLCIHLSIYTSIFHLCIRLYVYSSITYNSILYIYFFHADS